ncbi:hypothetical protein [Bacillus wiedmannii]|uniref:hypothetical protein n=1 Tax=Bacillus wiedmannii TaxID=1890302 RepID=UPI000CD85D14|nr:hypothetical protein [Bacillus wiedmannii]MBG9828594.1 hypothetical protein [Bacillus wiedmannii]UOB95814.1 hypothetical protein BTI679_31590 [Bacillus wiedmannii]
MSENLDYKTVDHSLKYPTDPEEYNGVNLRKLKELHREMLRYYVASDFNHEAVASKFDYHLKSVYRMVNYPASKAYVAWLLEDVKYGQFAGVEAVVQRLTDILNEQAYDEHVTPNGTKVIKKVDNKESLKAAELLGKHLGMFIEKKHVTTEQTIVVDIEGEDDGDGETIEI